MRMLFIGDIFGSPGRRIVADHLQDIVKAQAIDLAISNAENSAGGFGVTPAIAEDLFKLGIDVLTTGNHIWDKREIYDYIDRTPRLLRPANYPPGVPGSGVAVVKNCAILNLQGRVSAVVGTHTHVPTADTRVLPGGTAYQTDVGMTGPYDSVIGVEKEMIVKRFLTAMPEIGRASC